MRPESAPRHWWNLTVGVPHAANVPGGLAARETERSRHRLRVEREQAAHGGGGAERADHAGAVPAALAKLGEVEAEPDARRHLAAGRERDEEIASRAPVALRDRQRGRHDFGRDVRERRAMDVAHRHRGDEKPVQERRARRATGGRRR